METQEYNVKEGFSAFLRIAKCDARLSYIHISIYAVLFDLFLHTNGQSSFSISRKSVMSLSKIKSTATYHKRMSELHEFGYISYLPSYHPAIGSIVDISGGWIKSCVQGLKK